MWMAIEAAMRGIAGLGLAILSVGMFLVFVMIFLGTVRGLFQSRRRGAGASQKHTPIVSELAGLLVLFLMASGFGYGGYQSLLSAREYWNAQLQTIELTIKEVKHYSVQVTEFAPRVTARVPHTSFSVEESLDSFTLSSDLDLEVGDRVRVCQWRTATGPVGQPEITKLD